MGIDKTTQKARTYFFWPSMTNDIYRLVSMCNVCLGFQNQNPRQPLLSYPVTNYPWERVASDLFFWNNRSYLLVVDYYSKFFEYFELKDTSSECVIQHLKCLFARNGIPKVFISDNGPQYSSKNFAQFCKKWGITHLTSSPQYPRSNGLAEKSVQTLKKLLSKSLKSGSDANLVILQYRNTPIGNEGSPAQLLMGRRLRETLPVLETQYLPHTIDPSEVKKNQTERQERRKHYYNRGCRPLRPIYDGDSIHFKKGMSGSLEPSGTNKPPHTLLTLRMSMTTFSEEIENTFISLHLTPLYLPMKILKTL